MGDAKQEPEEAELDEQKRPAWQKGKGGGRDAKAVVDQPPKGLRSQGEVDVVPANAPKPAQEGVAKRREPTRHDAMEIAGHERLPGYDTPLDEPDAHMAPKAPRTAKGAPELEPLAMPEVPDLKGLALDADRELKRSSDAPEIERPQEKNEEFESERIGEKKERDKKAPDHAGDAEEAKG